MAKLVDICTSYIESKNCFYLAKEGQIVYFASVTGRESDADWIKQTVNETLRIVRATRLASDEELRDFHLIQAFQELDRVYEFGVRSIHGSAPGIFNFSEHGRNDVSIVAMAMTDVFMTKGITALTVSYAMEVMNSVLDKMGVVSSSSDRIRALSKYFTGVGYDHKSGSRRPQVEGRKQVAFMMTHTLPKMVVTSHIQTDSMVAEIYRRSK